jgi:hypothetical protein
MPTQRAWLVALEARGEALLEALLGVLLRALKALEAWGEDTTLA